MEPFKRHTGIAMPLDRVNVDTDAIIPKQFLRKIDRTGFGRHLFHEWRYLDYEGTKENPEFILNKQRYRGSSVLVTRDNFGCGSSREHAPWALADYGFRVIIAPSFADIFLSNCFKNGILNVVLSHDEVENMIRNIEKKEAATITADLMEQKIFGPEGEEYPFEIDAFAKECLLKGWDSISWSEQFMDKINLYEKKRMLDKPWYYNNLKEPS